MESLQFDGYASYSDASTPRTPSPRSSLASEDMQFHHSPPNYKPSLDLEPIRNIFSDNPPDDHTVIPESHHIHHVNHAWPSHGPVSHFSSSRGSLLQELYDDNHNVSESRVHDMSIDHHDRHYSDGPHWSGLPRHASHAQSHLSPPSHHRHDIGMMRRNTFPFAREDREGDLYSGPGSFGSRPDSIYAEPLPLDSSSHVPLTPEPASLHMSRVGDGFHPMSHSPASSYRDFDHSEGSGVKMEDHSPVIISSQSPYGHQQSPQMALAGYMSPHGIPIQHTDDAASKETQYLRRRCFNCHTTEPPSWRRSTLTPGKIVCNKCGLYERTHLRPRPLRFDELRAGNKARKQTTKTGSPKSTKVLPIKKEPAELDAISRRLSVSSTSSLQSGGASSDWEDGISVYSSGSAPNSCYNSPSVPPFPMPRDANSQSPPLGSHESSGIRLPNAPLTDIASLQGTRKPDSSPYFHANSLPVTQGDVYARRVVGQGEQQGNASLRRPVDIPEVTGWQTVPLTDIGLPGKVVRKTSNPMRKAVAA